jgi:hypothetical protein
MFCGFSRGDRLSKSRIDRGTSRLFLLISTGNPLIFWTMFFSGGWAGPVSLKGLTFPGSMPIGVLSRVFMSYDFAASMQGVRAAWDALGQTAHRIANGSVQARRTPPPGVREDPISGRQMSGSGDDTFKLDLAEEMGNLQLAKIGVQANTRVMAVERDLDKDTLDLFA